MSDARVRVTEKKKSRAESVDCTPPDNIMPGGKERPLLPLQPFAKEQKGPQCIKVNSEQQLACSVEYWMSADFQQVVIC